MPKRSYFQELDELDLTWDTTCNYTPILIGDLKPEFFLGTVYCIGSGGSMVLAKLWQQIYELNGLGFAKALTPYEFYTNRIIPDTVILFSASGKNHDILQVFREAIKRGCKIVIFTVSPKSELLRLAAANKESTVAIYPSQQPPKDGFLAVNSVIALASLIAYVQKVLFGLEVENDSPVKMAQLDHKPVKEIFLKEINTIQIVTSEWGNSAGWDLETRLSESGVSNCFVTDPRSFGHGRFIWLDKHRLDTLVVLIYTKDSSSFMNKFNKHLPEDTPRYIINSPKNGLWGAVYCLVRSMMLFGEFALSRSLDPGMPEVPDWGRKMHSLRVVTKDLAKPGKAIRNFPALALHFQAIVIDIDGTLVDTNARYGYIRYEIKEEIARLLELGLKFGFATGRGWSAIELLRECIQECYWPAIYVGLYNGTRIVKLSDQENDVNSVWPLVEQISPVVEKIGNQITNANISFRPTQISIRELSSSQKLIIREKIEKALKQNMRFVKVLFSEHSLDIIPSWGTKLAVIEMLNLELNANILCIGDQGQLWGNDQELLEWKPSISVGKERPLSNDCLWLGKKKELQGSNGVLAILKSIKHTQEGFIITEDDLN